MNFIRSLLRLFAITVLVSVLVALLMLNLLPSSPFLASTVFFPCQLSCRLRRSGGPRPANDESSALLREPTHRELEDRTVFHFRRIDREPKNDLQGAER